MHSEITENPFKEESQSISTAALQATDQQWQQLQTTGHSEDKSSISVLSTMKNTKVVEVDREGGDYRELEATFTMTHNTSYTIPTRT